MFPVSKELIQEYYSIEESPAYKRIADELDKIMEVGECKIYKKGCFVLKRAKFLLIHGRIFKFFFKAIYQFLYVKLGFQIKNDKFRKKYAINKWEENVKNRYDKLNYIKYMRMKEISNQNL